MHEEDPLGPAVGICSSILIGAAMWLAAILLCMLVWA